MVKVQQDVDGTSPRYTDIRRLTNVNMKNEFKNIKAHTLPDFVQKLLNKGRYHDEQEREDSRVIEEFKTYKFGEDHANREITAIPYDFIGKDITSLYDRTVPENERVNYPDWYKLTPVYKLSNSGMTAKEHVWKLIFDPDSQNHLFKRAVRWIKEDKTVVYCDWVDKLSAVASILVLLMTLLVTAWQIYIGASAVYTVPDVDPNTDKPDEILRLQRAKALDKIANHTLWKAFKIVFSAIPAIIVIGNVYKRTTVPLANVRIHSFHDIKGNKRVERPISTQVISMSRSDSNNTPMFVKRGVEQTVNPKQGVLSRFIGIFKPVDSKIGKSITTTKVKHFNSSEQDEEIEVFPNSPATVSS